MKLPCTNRRDFLKTLGAASLCGLAAPRTLWAASAAQRLGWRLGCCAYSFNRFTFYETLDKVAALGLQYLVGFSWQKLSPDKPDALFTETMSAAQRREAIQRLADSGLKMPGCYFNKWEDLDSCRRLFDFAAELGMEFVVGEPPTAKLDMLEKLCDEYTINLAIHNHARPTPNWQPETVLKMLEGRSPRVGACCDTGHWARSQLDPVATLRLLAGRIITFDLKDVDASGKCVPFGTGTAKIRDILVELHRQRFQGVLGIEYDSPTADPEKEIAQSIEFFNKTTDELAAAP